MSPLRIDAVVVGASWAGIWSLYMLKKKGLVTKLIDACPDVGGVWYYTRYPGCRVDTEVPFYEFSLPELWKEWKWSERFPSRVEIQRYLGWVCDKLHLRDDIIPNTRVTAAQWDDSTRRWTIWSAEKQLANAQFFLPCSGYSTIPHIPRYPGQEDFKMAFHSSQWPDKLEYSGKRVGIIGTGASGVQCIESIAADVAEMVVFQRTPNLVTPMRQEKFTDERRIKLKSEYPKIFIRRKGSRYGYGGEDQQVVRRTTFKDTPEQQRRTYETLYAKGGLAFWFDNYADLLTDSRANDKAYSFWREKAVERIVKPDVAEILAPLKAPHAFGTKRPSLETNYFEVFNQCNVTLVDVNKDAISRIQNDGIKTQAKFFQLDIIIYATGFDFITGSMLAMGIQGRDDRLLNDKWRLLPEDEGVFTHLGLMTAGYPNMFFPMGPQSPSALGITPYVAEIQVNWILECIARLKRLGANAAEPTERTEREWKKEVNRCAEMSLIGQTNSWYMGVNIRGRKKQPLCYFGGVDKYIDFLEKDIQNEFPEVVFY